MFTCIGYGTAEASQPLTRMTFERHDVGPREVLIDILFCGVCHSDIHTARNEWNGTRYPCVPGHEIVGRVSAIGSTVTRFKVGDLAGVGCMVQSCRTCPNCRDGLEQYCDQRNTGTYNSPDKRGGHTFGGYSNKIAVDEDFVLKLPENLPLAGIAPLLCAGVTTFAPLRRMGVGPGMKVGVIGLGGLGHLAVKIASAMGAHVVLFTTSTSKAADAVRLGADEVVDSKDPEAMKGQSRRLDMIIDAVSAPHDLDAYLVLLRRDGALILLGAPERPLSFAPFSLIAPRRHLSGSLIGGIGETQDMLDFCARHAIVADIEIIPIQRINEAYERVLSSDVRYRFVIDMSSLPAD